MTSLRSNGRLPEPEVIANFLDGHSYSKGKLEDAFRTLHLDRTFPKPARAPPSPFKLEDIELLVQEFEFTRAQAEKVLARAEGKLADALDQQIAML